MSVNETTTRAAKALAAAQESMRQEARERLCQMSIGFHPLVSNVLSLDGHTIWSPTLDIAVRLVESVASSAEIKNGQLNWTRGIQLCTNRERHEAALAAQQLTDTLHATGGRFALAYHLPGESEVEFHYAHQTRTSAIYDLCGSLARELQFLYWNCQQG